MTRISFVRHRTVRRIWNKYRACRAGVEKTRWHAVGLLARADPIRTPADGADLVDLSDVTVREVLHRWNADGPGGLADRRKGYGSASTLTARRRDAPSAALQGRPPDGGLPTLFFETKAVTGCQLGDLCGVRSKDLRDGKLYFTAETTKGRKQRVAVLRDDLYRSLKAIAGRTHLWESYTARLPEYLTRRGVPTHRVVPKFDPRRLSWWARDEVDDFNKGCPDRPKLRSHDFRKRAITEAHRAGMDVDMAAAAVGMSPMTARAYYLAIDQERAVVELTARLSGTLRPPKGKS